jgi:hypothetical protein
LKLENCGFDWEKKVVEKSDQGVKIPIVRIDQKRKGIKKEKMKSEENEEEQIVQNEISIPIYEKLTKDDFENIEPYGYIDFKFDENANNYDFWISSAIRLTIDI